MIGQEIAALVFMYAATTISFGIIRWLNDDIESPLTLLLAPLWAGPSMGT